MARPDAGRDIDYVSTRARTHGHCKGCGSGGNGEHTADDVCANVEHV